jgi:cytochrome c oxidase assembly protein subunit 15
LKKYFNQSYYRSYVWITVAAVFVLILLGGIVRSTGSGMGCPDWPKCFGQYVPPTEVGQLPPNYQQDFTNNRLQKAEKFANLLRKLGLDNQANTLLNDPFLYEPEVFNATKTWIEYVNRLWGALTGVFALLALFASFSYFKTQKSVVYLTVAAIFLIFFNAWLGSIVVSTNLLGWVVTVHYLLAYVAVFILMIAAYKVKQIRTMVYYSPIGLWLSLLLLFTFIQVISGTGLREQTDMLIRNMSLYDAQGELNVDGLGKAFDWHRVMALSVLIINIRLWFRLKKANYPNKNVQQMLLLSLILIMLQVLSGSLNLNFNFPVIAQVHHIFGAGILFGVQSYLVISYFSRKNLN